MYRVKYHKQVVKFLQSTQKNVAKKIIDSFDFLKQNPYENLKRLDVKKLESYENFYRLRVGKFRVIFSIDNDEILIEVIQAKSRGDIYK